LEAVGVAVKLDDRDTHKPGWKFAEYEMKGVPLRMAIGPKDLENNTIELARRDTKEKITVGMEGAAMVVQQLLAAIQENLYQRALAFKEAHTTKVDTFEEFKEVVAKKGGFVLAHWDGTTETEKKIQTATKATIRCIPLDAPQEEGVCIYSGKPSQRRVVFAQAY
jgi:prolyl-tRNA synthetase